MLRPVRSGLHNMHYLNDNAIWEWGLANYSSMPPWLGHHSVPLIIKFLMPLVYLDQ